MDAHLMTISEVAEKVRVTPRTVRRWIDEGQLPSSRVGAGVRVMQGDVEKFIRPSQARKPKPDMDALLAKVERMLAARKSPQKYSTAELMEEVRKGREDAILHRH